MGHRGREIDEAAGRGARPVRACCLTASLLLACGGEPERGVQVEPRVVSSAQLPAPTPAPTPAAKPEQAPAPAESCLGVSDRGVFSDLDPQLQLELPAELSTAQVIGLLDPPRALLLLYADGRPIKPYPLLTKGGRVLTLGAEQLRLRPGDHDELAPLLREAEQLRTLAAGAPAPPGDVDQDGLPDPLDLTLGAHKTVLNAADYDGRYLALDYPGGDVPREIGVCTDVVVRSLRNAGVDLQQQVHEDILRAPARYPMVSKANDDIDHRRVRTILPWFRRYWTALGEGEPHLPGDVIFMETIASRAGADHIGVVAGRRDGDGGEWLVANNWTEGYQTALMGLIGYVEITERYRLPPAPIHAGPIPPLATQLLLVVDDDWSSIHARGRRYQREIGGGWQAVDDPFALVLGHGGLGWGRGLHGIGAPPGQRGPNKAEGDGRSPAGVFAIGQAYGRASARALTIDYAQASPELRCVDDPASRHYGHIVDEAAVTRDWDSAEDMRRLYELAIVVEHNLAPSGQAEPGAGSCIFLHRWRDPETPVTGCAAMDPQTLDALAGWLEPGAVVVLLPAVAHRELATAWGLPPRP